MAEPDHNSNMQIRMDDGWVAHLKSREVIPWDAYLESEMPTIDFDAFPGQDEINPETADAFLRTNLVGMRKGMDSWREQNAGYFRGRAQAHANVAAALLYRDADPQMICDRGDALMGTDGVLEPGSLGDRHASPLSAARTRQLVWHFLTKAIVLQGTLSGSSEDERTDLDMDAQGQFNVYAAAAVRFSNGGRPGPAADYCRAQIEALIKGGCTDANAIFSECWGAED